MTTLSALPPQVYADARAILIGAAQAMAITKNVALLPGHDAEIAKQVMEVLKPATICAMIHCEPGAVKQAAGTINTLLDLFAAMQAIAVIQRTEGSDLLNPRQTLADAQEWIKRGIANDTSGDRRFRWPDPAVMAAGYFKARSSGPVRVQFTGEVRAAYLLDPSRCRSPNISAAKPDGFMPEPLLIRCPAFSPLKRTPKQTREAVDA